MIITLREADRIAESLTALLGVTVWANTTPHVKGNRMLTVSINRDLPVASITLPLDSETGITTIQILDLPLNKALTRLLESELKELS